MTQNTQNLVALVTGANRGLGLETARQLARGGVTVIMGGRDEAAIAAAAATLADEGLPVEPLILDVVNPAHHRAAAEIIQARHGRLDILVNNAGIITGEHFMENSATTVSTDALRQTYEVNLFAPIALTQTLLPLLKAAPAARIVNVSSILGSLTIQSDSSSPFFGAKAAAYNSSKAALNMYTVHLAHALKDTAIKVNAAHPGWVKTDMGTEAAPMEVVDGARTSVELALIGEEGPTGRYIHLGDELPW
jgi:NAD(P)-dependent dehydrogenase (short-subunit alcohol dehydrogenase family)